MPTFAAEAGHFFAFIKEAKTKNCIKLKLLYKSIKLNVTLVVDEIEEKGKQKQKQNAKRNIYQELNTIVFKFNIYITW